MLKMGNIELREHRRALGLTQQGLAKRIGLTREMIGLMERGVKSISARTAAAVMAAHPKALERRPTQYAPLLIKLEHALLEARIAYTIDHELGGEAVVLRLDELAIALYVAVARSDAPDKVTGDIDTISICGKAALNAFITLLQYGGVHARLGAQQDAYADAS